MKRQRRSFADSLILPAVLLGACSFSASEDTGSQGQVQDRGARLSVKRYYVDLGILDLHRSQERQFQVKGLPAGREFILGVRVEGGDCSIQRSPVTLAVSMTDELDRVVIHEQRPLSEFTWSTDRDSCSPAFGYVSGKAKEVRVNEEGDVCMQPIITGADEGHGTYFVSRDSAVYDVRLKTESPVNRKSAVPARVYIEDNGARTSERSPCD